MMHGSEWTLQYDEPEVENVTQWATFSTEGHHISNVTRTTMLHLFCRMTNHTHPFNGPFSGTTGWAGTRKVKPVWILLKQETVSGSGISWACASLHLAPDR